MNNLKKFSTEADYSAATLNYPAVSWVTATDTVHFDKSGAAVNNKVKIAFTTDACGQGKEFNVISLSYFSETLAILNGITVNGEPFTPSGSDAKINLAANTDYLIEYELKDGVTDVNNCFAITPAVSCASALIKYDLLFPSQVTSIGGLYQNGFNALILESTTPPNFTLSGSDFPYTYVPDSAVNTYKSEWDNISGSIFPISQYSGNIPT